MAQLVFKNDANTTIIDSIGPDTTDIRLQPGTGSNFATPAAGQYYVASLHDAGTGLSNEIVWVTGMTGDVAHCVRGQEGTTKQSWSPGDSFAELWTAGQAGLMLQKGDEQAGTSTYGQDVGAPNNYQVVLNPALTSNSPGQTFRFKAANSNTGASTINYGTGSAPLLNAQGHALSGGEIIAGYVYETYWNGVSYNLAMPSLVAIPTGMIVPYAGGALPGGWLACNGQAVANTDYPALFAVIGTTYGGNGAPNFNIPDLRGMVTAHLDGGKGVLSPTDIPNGGPNTPGGWGGAADVSLTSAQLPAHSHVATVNDTGHTHSVTLPSVAVSGAGSGGFSSGTGNNMGQDTPTVTSGSTASGVSINIGNTGSGAAHPNMQPTMMLMHMIKT